MDGGKGRFDLEDQSRGNAMRKLILSAAILAAIQLPASAHRASWHDYKNNKMTTASRHYPCGTRVQITNKANRKSVIVTVADWGPAKWTGRRWDLNKAAFSKIADVKRGEIRVSAKIMSIGKCRTHRH